MKKMLRNIVGEANISLIKGFFKNKTEKDMEKKRLEFYSQFLQKGDTYFDVGANYGNRIEAIIKIGVNIVAVEPQEKCFNFLQKKYGSKINIVNKGLGEKEEVKKFFIANSHVLSSFSEDWIDSMKKSGRFSNNEWNNKAVEVPMTTLDNLIKKFGKPAFIKIDVEGYELEVLKGLSVDVDCISYEYATPEQTQRAVNCLLRLQEIKGAMECNYSIGESMEWGSPRWLPAKEMLEFIQTDAFTNTDFGDIYVRTPVGK
jgi:FkbM family methyltransferase